MHTLAIVIKKKWRDRVAGLEKEMERRGLTIGEKKNRSYSCRVVYTHQSASSMTIQIARMECWNYKLVEQRTAATRAHRWTINDTRSFGVANF